MPDGFCHFILHKALHEDCNLSTIVNDDFLVKQMTEERKENVHFKPYSKVNHYFIIHLCYTNIHHNAA